MLSSIYIFFVVHKFIQIVCPETAMAVNIPRLLNAHNEDQSNPRQPRVLMAAARFQDVCMASAVMYKALPLNSRLPLQSIVQYDLCILELDKRLILFSSDELIISLDCRVSCAYLYPGKTYDSVTFDSVRKCAQVLCKYMLFLHSPQSIAQICLAGLKK